MLLMIDEWKVDSGSGVAEFSLVTGLAARRNAAEQSAVCLWPLSFSPFSLLQIINAIVIVFRG
jgi:hypothetical protein